MAWRILDGDYYVSKNGDDVLGDGTKENPFASINAAINIASEGSKIVIGSGVWEEIRGNNSDGSMYGLDFYGDGNVIFDYGNGIYFGALLKITGSDRFENIEFKNNHGVHIGIIYTKTVFTTPYAVSFYNCKIDWVGLAYIGGSCTVASMFENCFIQEADYTILNNNAYNFIGFKNCTVMSLGMVRQSTSKVVTLFECINSIFMYASNTGYAPTLNKIPVYNFVRDSAATIFYHSSNIIGLDPRFNNSEIGDYTLAPNSPCLYRGIGNKNIGCYGKAYNFNSNSHVFSETGGAILSNVEKAYYNIGGIEQSIFKLVAGFSNGYAESTWIDFQIIEYILVPHIFGSFLHDENGEPSASPDFNLAYDLVQRYDFELKYCTDAADKDTVNWKTFSFSDVASIDASGNGNGDPNFDILTEQYISARYIKIRITLNKV